jgi:hypothetical protein
MACNSSLMKYFPNVCVFSIHAKLNSVVAGVILYTSILSSAVLLVN